MNKAKEYWKIIIHTPWRIDEWIFWAVIVIMSALFIVLTFLGVTYTKSIIA